MSSKSPRPTSEEPLTENDLEDLINSMGSTTSPFHESSKSATPSRPTVRAATPSRPASRAATPSRSISRGRTPSVSLPRESSRGRSPSVSLPRDSSRGNSHSMSKKDVQAHFQKDQGDKIKMKEMAELTKSYRDKFTRLRIHLDGLLAKFKTLKRDLDKNVNLSPMEKEILNKTIDSHIGSLNLSLDFITKTVVPDINDVKVYRTPDTFDTAYERHNGRLEELTLNHTHILETIRLRDNAGQGARYQDHMRSPHLAGTAHPPKKEISLHSKIINLLEDINKYIHTVREKIADKKLTEKQISAIQKRIEFLTDTEKSLHKLAQMYRLAEQRPPELKARMHQEIWETVTQATSNFLNIKEMTNSLLRVLEDPRLGTTIGGRLTKRSISRKRRRRKNRTARK